jgi:hypothetical protein
MGAVSEIPSEWLAEFEAAARRRSTADGVRKTFPTGSTMGAFEYRQPFAIPMTSSPGKVAAHRAKDRKSLGRLRSFREYWLRQRKP